MYAKTDSSRVLAGIYRGVVVDTRDLQHRNRYRVHVYKVHNFKGTQTWLQEGEDAPSAKSLFYTLILNVKELVLQRDGGAFSSTDFEAVFDGYPWAEVTAGTAKGSGSSPVYTVGDVVWVMFEDGDPQYPVIMGGWTSNSFGMHDLIPEKGAGAPEPFGTTASGDASNVLGSDDTALWASYQYSRFRWSMTDRRGNLLESSEIPDEMWTKLSANAGRFTIDGLNDAAVMEGPGYVFFDNPTFVGLGQSFFATYETEICFQIFGPPPDYEASGGGIEPILALYSTWDMDLWAQDEMAIGQYLSRATQTGSGSVEARNTRRQTRFAWMGAKYINVGVACPEPWLQHSTYPLDPENDAYENANFTATTEVRVEAEDRVIVRSTGGPSSSASSASACPTYCSDLNSGDIFLWAAGRIILRADGGFVTCPSLGAGYDAVITGVTPINGAIRFAYTIEIGHWIAGSNPMTGGVFVSDRGPYTAFNSAEDSNTFSSGTGTIGTGNTDVAQATGQIGAQACDMLPLPVGGYIAVKDRYTDTDGNLYYTITNFSNSAQ